MKNIAVLFGGKSVEHDISIITALQMMNDFPKEYKLIPVYIKHDGTMITAENLLDANTYLDFEKNVRKEMSVQFCFGQKQIVKIKKNKIKQRIEIDCALLCNHGNGGEDGSLQGALELCDIPYTSCNVLSSALTIDKAMTKLLLLSEDIDTPKYVQFSKFEYDGDSKKIIKKISNFSYPVIVKPVRCGSSVGISVCNHEKDLNKAVKYSMQFDSKVIVEEFINNAREFCCAVIESNGRFFTSKPKEVKKGEFFTFEEKYINENGKCENEITKELVNKIQTISQKTYTCLQCSGVVRVDFLYEEKAKRLYVNEVNSIPGSLSFNMFETRPNDIIRILVEEALKKFEEKRKIVYSFNSKAIESYIALTNRIKMGK